MPAQGISREYRQALDELHRRFQAPFSVSDASEVLGLTEVKAGRRLAHLAAQGWLSRVRRNAYVTVPLGAERPSEWREDPWVVGARVFAPCYLGGWTACEHWGLTEQVFRSIRVVCTRRIRHRKQKIQDTDFVIKVVADRRIFGTQKIWRGPSQVEISDPSRTVLDLLDDPTTGGGIRQVSEMVSVYFASEHRQDAVLAAYTERLGNRTAWKRLGYLLETLSIDAPDLVAKARAGQSRGVSLLDPSLPARGRVTTRWSLRINVDVRRPSP